MVTYVAAHERGRRVWLHLDGNICCSTWKRTACLVTFRWKHVAAHGRGRRVWLHLDGNICCSTWKRTACLVTFRWKHMLQHMEEDGVFGYI